MCADRKFNINIDVDEGRLDGLRLVTKTGWNGIIIICPRSSYVEAREYKEFKRCGVYILLGEDEDSGTPIIYIGEGDKVVSRLKDHYEKKDFWQQAIIFTSQNNTLNKALVRYLEAKLVNLALVSNQCKLENGQTELNLPNLSKSDRNEVEWYLNEMLPLLPILGITVFEEPKAITRGSGDVIEYRLEGNGFSARGYETTNNGFVVRKGSTAVSELRDHAIKMGRLYAIRQELIGKKVLRKITGSDGYEFTVDYPFRSPSTAATICMGRSANGRKEWKDKNGVSFGDNHKIE